MTTAIEQTKREMYRLQKEMLDDRYLDGIGDIYYRLSDKKFGRFESAYEDHLEQLRQQYEQMALTARDRFESVQQLEAANALLAAQLARAKSEVETFAARNETQRQIIEEAGGTNDLLYRLGKMKQERDDIQGRLHAVDHKCFNLDQASAIVGDELRQSREMIKNQKTIIDKLHALKEAYRTRTGTSAQVSRENASCDESRANAVMILLGALVDSQRIVTDWAMNDLKAKKAIRNISAVVNGCPDVLKAMKVFEKQSCMHSFFAIGDDQMKCTFCGAGK